jgi:hypothetical protein
MWVVQQEGLFWAEDEEMGGQDDRDKKAFLYELQCQGIQASLVEEQGIHCMMNR